MIGKPVRVVVGHEGVEGVRPDRQPDAGHRRDLGDPTAGGGQDGAGGDRAARSSRRRRRARRLETKAGDRCVLEQVDPALRRDARVRPGDPVVAGRRALDVVRAAQHRVAAATGQVELRDELLELLRACA